MKISEKLPQFEKKSLLIVAGRRMADIYYAFEGEIEKIDSVAVNEPKYSDKEGFFMRMGKGKFFGSGSVLEDKKEETNKKFMKELKEKTEDYFKRNNIEEIYFFASDYVKKNFPSVLAKEIGEKIMFSAKGNYAKSHPNDLIKKIKKDIDGKRPKFISEAAMKILKRKK